MGVLVLGTSGRFQPPLRHRIWVVLKPRFAIARQQQQKGQLIGLNSLSGHQLQLQTRKNFARYTSFWWCPITAQPRPFPPKRRHPQPLEKLLAKGLVSAKFPTWILNRFSRRGLCSFKAVFSLYRCLLMGSVKIFEDPHVGQRSSRSFGTRIKSIHAACARLPFSSLQLFNFRLIVVHEFQRLLHQNSLA